MLFQYEMYLRKVILFSILFLLIFKLSIFFYQNSGNINVEERQILDELAIKYNSGKSSLMHNYTPIYEKIFSQMRHKPITLLEIGVFQGGSLMMWENYFTAADLHFIDLTEKYLMYNYTRSKIHILNQSDQAQLEKFANEIGRQFDVIIDDGGHKMEEQITTFKVLFKILKPRGIYVIEDLQTSYYTFGGGYGDIGGPRGASLTAMGYLKDLVDNLNFIAAFTGFAATGNLTRLNTVRNKIDYYTEHIHSIHFYSNICLINKK